MNKDNYQKVLQKIAQQNKDDKIKFLRNIPFLAHWSKAALNKFVYAMTENKYTRGQRIIKEGDAVEYIYIVKSGEFEVRIALKFSHSHTLYFKKILKFQI